MIHTYGPGAIIDLPQLSVVLSGIDRWNLDHAEVIREPRLLGAVRGVPGCGRVVDFRTPPWMEETPSPFDDWALTGVPVYPFPRWLRCTRCDLLAPVDRGLFDLDVNAYRPDRAGYVHQRCGNRRASAVPARFIIACPAGHLDDFPWEQFVHGPDPCAGQPILALKEGGRSSRATSVRVECQTCGVARGVQGAFGPGANRHLPRCRGRHPHLQRFDDSCGEPTRALLLGASNSWFPVYRSALTIPTVTGEIEQKVADHWDALAGIEDRASLDLMVRLVPGGALDRRLRWIQDFDPGDLWAAIAARRGDAEASVVSTDIRGPEWIAFTSPLPPRSDDFSVRALDIPEGFRARLGNPVALDRLREVQALCGFTRIDGPEEGDATRIAPIRNVTGTWLPAAEMRGEGILITLSEAAIEGWERRYGNSARSRDLEGAVRDWRTRRGLDPAFRMPPDRFVLLHTLAHLLMRQVALECGYSMASIRERIYCRKPGDAEGPPMSGVLLYTAAPDSEGTLGGLVALSEPRRLARVLREGLDNARICSTDPMCAEHRAGSMEDSLHHAACHACLFAPETSCEAANRYLDRGAVVPILGRTADAYFP